MYTTYFAKAKQLPDTANLVSIARKTPVGFPGKRYMQLAPTSQMLYEVKQTNNKEKYTQQFRELLSKLNVHEVVKELGEDAILTCYEGYDKFCHRHIVADWLRESGYEVSEYVYN